MVDEGGAYLRQTKGGRITFEERRGGGSSARLHRGGVMVVEVGGGGRVSGWGVF